MKMSAVEKLEADGNNQKTDYLLVSDGMPIGVFSATDFPKIRHLGGLRGNSIKPVNKNFVKKTCT